MSEDYLSKRLFNDVNLSDEFFDSLRANYKGFDQWFAKKARQEEKAYVSTESSGNINAFLYLKEEDGEISDIEPALGKGKHLKVGTFKINAHRTAIGNRFMAIILRKFVAEGFDDAYVTMFPDTEPLRKLFEKFGFKYFGRKGNESSSELVLLRTQAVTGDIYNDFPKFDFSGRKFFLSIFPEFHTQMVPESRLKTEKQFVREDISPANNVVKVFLTSMYGVTQFSHGDKIVLYRTREEGKKAEYNAVATSICVVDEMKNISSFPDENAFLDYTSRWSVFSEEELRGFWATRKYRYVIRFLFNVPLDKRITRHDLFGKKILDEVVRQQRFDVVEMNDVQFDKLLKAGDVNGRFIIN
jgi:hypothetical protein